MIKVEVIRDSERFIRELKIKGMQATAGAEKT